MNGRLLAVVEQIADAQVGLVARMQRDGRILGGERHGPIDGPDRPAFRLHHRASSTDRLDERLRGAIKARRFGCVKLDEAIVDAQAAQRGEDVFDETDVDRRLPKRRASRGAGDVFHAGWNARLRAEIAAHENHPRRRGSWPEAHANMPAGHIARAVNLDDGADSLLIAILNSFHGGIILEACGRGALVPK